MWANMRLNFRYANFDMFDSGRKFAHISGYARNLQYLSWPNSSQSDKFILCLEFLKVEYSVHSAWENKGVHELLEFGEALTPSI